MKKINFSNVYCRMIIGIYLLKINIVIFFYGYFKKKLKKICILVKKKKIMLVNYLNVILN